jgi:hypothetical protein
MNIASDEQRLLSFMEQFMVSLILADHEIAISIIRRTVIHVMDLCTVWEWPTEDSCCNSDMLKNSFVPHMIIDPDIAKIVIPSSSLPARMLFRWKPSPVVSTDKPH